MVTHGLILLTDGAFFFSAACARLDYGGISSYYKTKRPRKTDKPIRSVISPLSKIQDCIIALHRATSLHIERS